jgi:hypothetical protein
METTSSMHERHASAEPTDESNIGITNQLVVFFFMLVFLAFGVILLGDLMMALWR